MTNNDFPRSNTFRISLFESTDRSDRMIGYTKRYVRLPRQLATVHVHPSDSREFLLANISVNTPFVRSVTNTLPVDGAAMMQQFQLKHFDESWIRLRSITMWLATDNK